MLKLTDAEMFGILQNAFMKYVEYAFGDIVDIEDWSYFRGAVCGVWQTVCYMKHIGKIDNWHDVIDKYNEVASAIVSPEYEYKEFKGLMD